jgi:hypothetical protein
MRLILSRFALAVALVLLLCLPVLADKPAAPVVVEGKVTYKGKPLPAGTIAFHPAKGKPVKAVIKEDGSYTAKDVPVGQVRVTIETESVKKAAKKKDKVEKAPKYVAIPLKYGDPKTTPLVVEVKAGRQIADIQLND